MLSAVGSLVLTAPAQGAIMAASALTPTSANHALHVAGKRVDRHLGRRVTWASHQEGRYASIRELFAYLTIYRVVKMADDRIRRPMDSRQAAEAAFKKATTKPLEPVARQPSIPNAKELVSLRIDRDVLEYFQESGPGWQDRINEALKKVAGK
jgi:uncharacterized protein (DUF4415 family)